MVTPPFRSCPELLDERGPLQFRTVFGKLLSESAEVDTAILNVRLGAVDFSSLEVSVLRRLRVLVAEVNAQTVEGEAHAMAVDPRKRRNLARLLRLFRDGILEVRSAPLGGWSPDFTVFSEDSSPHALLVGLHWFQWPFPHRGPAWAARFGPTEAHRAHARYEETWKNAHDISPAIRRLMERGRDRA